MSGPSPPSYPLRPARVHEVSGPASMNFALWTAREMDTDMLWVRPRWQIGMLNPMGFDGYDPSRLLLALTANQVETLAIAEEALRSGAVPFVVLEITAPLSLTVGRRLQLAAAEGGATGLCLIPGGMGSNAAETRWHCTPVFSEQGAPLHLWVLSKNKAGVTGSWHVQWDAEARRVAVVSPAGDLKGSAGRPAAPGYDL